MARPGAAGRLFIQQRQLARFRVDGEGADGALGLAAPVANFFNGVEQPSVRMQGEERWVLSLCCQLGCRQRFGSRIEHSRVNPVALGTGISPDINTQGSLGAHYSCT